MQAVARLYHAYFTGLILTLVTRRSAADAAEWVFRVFRHQHHEKFLSSFDKLGLTGMPDAVACAAYHYLSNSIGGVSVEFMRESDRKAWVNFVPPRWIYPGASICGVPSEVSRAILRGWYAQNGVSLGNPRLGFVCTAQTTDGQHGLSGYFLEHDRDLAPEERLQFRPGELAPPFDPAAAPRLPASGLAARAPRQGRAQLRHGVHPHRPAAAGGDLRPGRGRAPRPRHRPARRRAALSRVGAACSALSRQRRRGTSGASWCGSPPAKAMRPRSRRRATPCSCIARAGG